VKTPFIELLLVLLCLATSVVAFAKLFFYTLRRDWLIRQFKKRLALVDPSSSAEIFEDWGIRDAVLNDLVSLEAYLKQKGRGLDPELRSLGERALAPPKNVVLTVLCVPGGFVAAILVLVVFDAFLHNLGN